jgi:hypothetical protein
MIRGTLQTKRKNTQGSRKAPPPFAAAILGNRQMLPVPTAIPMTEMIIPHLDVNLSLELKIVAPWKG